MIAIREGALVVVAPPGGSVSFTIDQLDQAEAYRRGSPALRPDTLRGDRSIVVTAASATHACASGCRRQVAAHHFACLDCWWRLPSEMRDTITATGGDPDAHVEAMLSAIAWYREELPRAPIDDQSSVPVERTAVPADPPWPRIVEGRCSWCGAPESEHDGGLREHHRIEVVAGRYDDERESDEREAERRVLDVVRDLFAVLDAHGYRRPSDDAALGRAVVAVWQLVEEYEGQTDSGIARQRPDGS